MRSKDYQKKRMIMLDWMVPSVLKEHIRSSRTETISDWTFWLILSRSEPRSCFDIKIFSWTNMTYSSFWISYFRKGCEFEKRDPIGRFHLINGSKYFECRVVANPYALGTCIRNLMRILSLGVSRHRGVFDFYIIVFVNLLKRAIIQLRIHARSSWNTLPSMRMTNRRQRWSARCGVSN